MIIPLTGERGDENGFRADGCKAGLFNILYMTSPVRHVTTV